MGGVYCEDCDIAEPAGDSSEGGVHAHATDPEQAARLWALSADLTGVDAFAGGNLAPDVAGHRFRSVDSRPPGNDRT
jgi:hypothetical protein